jgi:2-polyprenyl-6-methoxyphenol hydroxylase-like FAD-dependent oxidoreductase
MPEDRQGRVIMVAKQVRMEERSREQWDEFGRDKEQLCQFYRDGYDEWGDTAKSIIDAVCRSPDTLYMWPFMKMARLQRWSSKAGRVIIIGDAAHALPPSSGQGVNQTLEDVYSLTRLLQSNMDLRNGLALWQEMRQTRLDAVLDWATNATNVARMPQAERDRLVQEGKAKDANTTAGFDDMRWLYEHKIDEKMDVWLEHR